MSKNRKLHIAEDLRFRCIQCGQCCRRWHVALSKKDLDRLEKLDWKGQDWAPPEKVITKIHGHPYLAHRPDGECVFLNPDTNLCRIHSQFGEKAKPLGCQVYPLNVASTFRGEASVNLRFDCPAVQRQEGRPVGSAFPRLTEYVQELNPSHALDRDDTCGFSREALDVIIEGAVTVTGNPQLAPPVRAMALIQLARRLSSLGPAFVNDLSTMRRVMPSFLERTVQDVHELVYPPVGSATRGVYRQWLATYLRRDEEMVGRGAGGRVKRTLMLGRLLAGRGSFNALGQEHPDIDLRDAGMFDDRGGGVQPPPPPSQERDAVWEPYTAFLVARLQTLQFFGVSYYGSNLVEGLRALAQTYGLVLGAARLRAAAGAWDTVNREDIQYAVGAIDHSFGRSRLLQMRLLRSFEIYFDRCLSGRLFRTLDWQ